MRRIYIILTIAALITAVSGSVYSGVKTEPPTSTPTVTAQTKPEAPPAAVAASPKAGETIDWQVLSSGGGTASSSAYSMSGTACQTAIGMISSENYQMGQGYWPAMSSVVAPGCCQIVGDVNHDGAGPDIADLVYLVNYMFNGGPPPPCDEGGLFVEADVNGDGAGPDIADLVYLVNYMFNGGPPPAGCP
ncbi:MAG: hypothetical protein ABIE70_01180 [bacterium]